MRTVHRGIVEWWQVHIRPRVLRQYPAQTLAQGRALVPTSRTESRIISKATSDLAFFHPQRGRAAIKINRENAKRSGFGNPNPGRAPTRCESVGLGGDNPSPFSPYFRLPTPTPQSLASLQMSTLLRTAQRRRMQARLTDNLHPLNRAIIARPPSCKVMLCYQRSKVFLNRQSQTRLDAAGAGDPDSVAASAEVLRDRADACRQHRHHSA